MTFFQFERRPINPRAIFTACMLGLSIGIPAVAMLPFFLTPTNTNGDTRQPVQVLRINNSEVEFEHPDGGIATLPLSEFRESYGLGGTR